MAINYRTETNESLGVNSFDLQQSTASVSNGNATQTFISFLQSSSRFIEQISSDFSSLRSGIKEGGLAYVENAEGTQWLPYTIGGTYYPKGWYVWDGAQWISSKSNVAETLEALGSGGGGSGFSGDYNDLSNLPTIPTDTVLSDADIASLGYIKTFTNTQLSQADIEAFGFSTVDNNDNTQLSDSDIAAFGYVKTDNNTQLTDADIAALGYVKTDNDTQLSDADITALGYVKTDNNTQLTQSEIEAFGFSTTDTNTQLTQSEIEAFGFSTTDNNDNTQLSDADIEAFGYVKTSGTNTSFFQVQDDGVTGQVVSSGYQNAAIFWDTPTITNSDFTFDNSLGHLTVNKAGIIEIDAKLASYNSANNRHELYIELQKNGVSLTSDAQYASRNNTQRVGGAYIMGFKADAVIGDIFKLRTKRVGVEATIGVTTAAKMSYFSAKLYS